MKKVILAMTALTVMLAFASCDKNHDNNDYQGSQTAANYDARAQALGFDNAADYQAYVAEQCAAGNHQNCDTYADGSHQACGYADHSGQNHDGTNHNGTDHGQHDKNGHNHNGKHH